MTANGIFRPIALVDGVAAGTWSIQPTAVELRPFAPLADDAVQALERDAGNVLRYLGLEHRPLRVV